MGEFVISVGPKPLVLDAPQKSPKLTAVSETTETAESTSAPASPDILVSATSASSASSNAAVSPSMSSVQPLENVDVSQEVQNDDAEEPESVASPSTMKAIAAIVKVTPPETKTDGADEKEKDTDLVFKLKAKRKRRVPEYIKTMFDDYCASVTKLNIDFERLVSLSGGYRAWRDILMVRDESWLKLDVLLRLFPRCAVIELHFIRQAFTKKTVKHLIAFLNSPELRGRDVEISVFRPAKYDTQSLFGANDVEAVE